MQEHLQVTRPSSLRLAAATAALTLGAIVPAALPASAAAPTGAAATASAATSSPDVTPVTAGSRGDGLPQRAVTSAGTAGRRAGAAAATTTPVALSTECPVGMKRVTTILSEGFEKGTLPEVKETRDWTVGTGAADAGTYFATSTVAKGAVVDVNDPAGLYMPLVSKAVADRTVVQFAIRGSYAEQAAFVRVNDESAWIAPSANWGLVTLDVTGTVAADLQVDLAFYNAPATTPADSKMDIDSVQIYRCSPVAATGVRGDFSGDKVADLLGVTASGGLYIAQGTGTGTFRTPVLVNRGFGRMTWIGSPGDVNGDKRPDLVARRDDGLMFFYAGRGMGAFSTAVKIGAGFNNYNAFVTTGDMTKDGTSDLLIRHNNGSLYRFSIYNSGKAIGLAKKLSTGFGAYTALTSTGDFNADGRGDLLARTAAGALFAFPTTTAGVPGAARQVGSGWQNYTAFAGPGDVNKNGTGDLVARTASGNLVTYLTNNQLGWAKAVQAGVGYDVFTQLF